MDKDFEVKRVLWNKENSKVFLGKDSTCVKKVDLPKCFSRLENEAECLKILDGNVAPKLISYNHYEHELRMEYISGLTLTEYIEKYGEIPTWFFARLASKLLLMLDYGIEYGGDMKYNEHIIVIPEKNDLRIIDFGISNILSKTPDIIQNYREFYLRKYAFVFENSKDDLRSKESIKDTLDYLLIEEETIQKYFSCYETIKI